MRHRIWSPTLGNLTTSPYLRPRCRQDYLDAGISVTHPNEFTDLPPTTLSLFTLQYDWPTRVLVELAQEHQLNHWAPDQENPTRYLTNHDKEQLWDSFSEHLGYHLSKGLNSPVTPNSNYWLCRYQTSPNPTVRAFTYNVLFDFVSRLKAGEQPTQNNRLEHILLEVRSRPVFQKYPIETVDDFCRSACRNAGDVQESHMLLAWVKEARVLRYLEKLIRLGLARGDGIQ